MEGREGERERRRGSVRGGGERDGVWEEREGEVRMTDDDITRFKGHLKHEGKKRGKQGIQWPNELKSTNVSVKNAGILSQLFNVWHSVNMHSART